MIHAVTPYGRDGPSSRVRVFEWLDRTSLPSSVTSYVSHRNASASHLARHPGRVLAAERRLRRLVSTRPDTLVLHREASPFSRGGLERRLLDRAGVAVYDFDDALQWDHGEGGVHRRLAPKAPKALLAVQRADRVIAGNEVLANWASAHARDVLVIPSCVAPDRYFPKADYQLADPPRLGWIGSPDNERFLTMIEPALDAVHRATGARLTVIGTIQRRLGPLERLIDRVAWSEDAQHSVLSTFDVGVAPLPDEPYERGKCGYRLLQFAAVGLPFVASPVGVNRGLSTELGMPAPESLAEWTDAVFELLEAPASVRAGRGADARVAVRARYSYDAWLPEWERAVGVAHPAAR